MIKKSPSIKAESPDDPSHNTASDSAEKKDHRSKELSNSKGNNAVNRSSLVASNIEDAKDRVRRLTLVAGMFTEGPVKTPTAKKAGRPRKTADGGIVVN